MKLKYKILLGFAALTAILLVIEGYTLFSLNRTNTSISEIVEKQFATEQIVQDANVIVIRIHSDIWDAMLFGKDIRETRAEEVKVRAREFYIYMRQLGDYLPEKRAALNDLSNLFRVYFQFGAGILEFKDLDEFNRKVDVVLKFKENKSELITLLNDTVADSSRQFERSLFDLKRNFQATTLITTGLTGVIILLAVLMSLLITSALTRPIESLMTAMKAFETGDLNVQAEVHTHDELGALARAFNTMGQQLRENIRDREQLLADNVRMNTEMDLARRIQTSLLPKLDQYLHPDLEIAAIMLPAEEVGGDYYDVLSDRKGHLWLGIGDVCGHGVTPGLIMMMAQTVHATITTQYNHTPQEVVNTVNAMLYQNVHERLGENSFMTFTTLKYGGGGRFEHAGAHLSMFVHRQQTGVIERIQTSGVWLNFIPDISHATRSDVFMLNVGDTLLLYTDGLTEAHGPAGELLDIPRFQEIILRHAAKPVEALRDAIMADVIAWCDNDRDDDMTLVVVRRKE